MKGYYVTNGYMGCVDGVYMLFADESDYLEYVEDWKSPGQGPECSFAKSAYWAASDQTKKWKSYEKQRNQKKTKDNMRKNAIKALCSICIIEGKNIIYV